MISRRCRPAAVLMLVGAVLFGSAGCESADGENEGADPATARESWPDTVPKEGLARGLVLPVEAYLQSYEQSTTIEQASRKLQVDCMSDFGFSIKFPPLGVNPPPSNNSANTPRRYGITNAKEAAERGYQLKEAQGGERPQNFKLTDAETAVLTGRKSRTRGAEPAPATYQGKAIPKDGCQGWAFDKIGARLDFTLPEKLSYESLNRSQESPRVQAALTAWSACMRESGYEVPHPFEAIKRAPDTVVGSPSQSEINVAVADVECKKKVDLVAIWYAEDAQIQRDQIAHNALVLDELRKKNSSAVKAAEAVLRG
ncbi:hypothetical protein AB0D97_21105 [Streptomyces roseus]|uniref:hypothetical protein n=1 Tax=Streptomyces roseus TaxID=66430 RepID=UPI0033E66BE9